MTKRAWHRQVPELYAQVEAAVAAAYPGLSSAVRNGLIHFTGPFVLVDALGTEVDRYEIDIRLPANFPKGVPEARETAGRIPRTPDHHCYSDGTLCLFAPGERWRYGPKGRAAYSSCPTELFVGIPWTNDGPVDVCDISHVLVGL